LAVTLRRVEQTDGELLRGFLVHNDQQAFTTLVKRHGPLVLAVCRRVLFRIQDAEDAFQATFLLLARRASGLVAADSVGGWLHEVGYRMAMNIRRAAARRRKYEGKAIVDRPDTTATETARRELQQMLDEAVGSLASKYREPFVLCCLGNLSCSEAARRLHIKEGTVWSRLAEARKRLQRRLTRRGITPGLALGTAALGADSTLAGMPAELVARTAHAVALLKGGQSLGAGVVSSQALALLHSMGKNIMITRAIFSSFLLLGLGLLGAGFAFGIPESDGSLPSGEVAKANAKPGPTRTGADKPAAGAKKAEPPQGWLTGKVVGPDGNPIAGARVWTAAWPEKAFLEGTADSAGRFRLGPLPATSRTRRDLFAEAPGLARAYVDTPVVLPDTDHDLGVISLPLGNRYRGQVVLEDGAPAAQVDVRAEVQRLELGHTFMTIGAAYEAKTDRDGRFELPPLPVGDLSVTFKRPDCQVGSIGRKILPGPDETLETVRLRKDVPFAGRVQDSEGKPIAGAEVTATGEIEAASTDENGRFVLRGMGKDRPNAQGRVQKRGYCNAPLNLDRPDPVITLKSAAYIYGAAVDAVTGQPVTLDRVITCYCRRGPNGELQLSGCSDSGFEQLKEGKFRVAYMTPGEYHLAAAAAGYRDAEAFTPKIVEFKDIQGIVLKLNPKGAAEPTEEPKNGLTGRATRAGLPVTHALVGLWQPAASMNAPNSYMLRGRTTTGPGWAMDEAPVREDGSFFLKVPSSGKYWYVVVREPGQPPTLVGPLSLVMNEPKTLDISCTQAGSISGRVKQTPAGLEGQLWVVAFTKTGYRTETRVTEGRYAFPALPPGEYGLKVGHDAFTDSEIHTPLLGQPNRELTKTEKERFVKEFNTPSDPWKRAKTVRVEEAKETADVELELPKE